MSLLSYLSSTDIRRILWLGNTLSTKSPTAYITRPKREKSFTNKTLKEPFLTSFNNSLNAGLSIVPPEYPSSYNTLTILKPCSLAYFVNNFI